MTTGTLAIDTEQIELVSGDKIRFLVKEVGLFVGYVKYITGRAISLKGCKLVDIHDIAYSMNNVNLDYYKEQHTHTFLTREIGQVEVLEKSPF